MRVEGWPRLCGYPPTVANFQAGAFFFFLNAQLQRKERGGGGVEDETIDLIMHACFLIHCNGGKGREGKGCVVGGVGEADQ